MIDALEPHASCGKGTVKFRYKSNCKVLWVCTVLFPPINTLKELNTFSCWILILYWKILVCNLEEKHKLWSLDLHLQQVTTQKFAMEFWPYYIGLGFSLPTCIACRSPFFVFDKLQMCLQITTVRVVVPCLGEWALINLWLQRQAELWTSVSDAVPGGDRTS